MPTSTLEELKALIVERARPMAEQVLAAHRLELEDLPRDEVFQRALRDAVIADVEAAATGFRFDEPLPRLLTHQTEHFVRVAARSRVSLTTLLRLFRVGQRVVWDEIRRALPEIEPDPAVREQILGDITELVLRGGDRLSTLQTEEYLAERDRITRTREQKRLAIVQDLLAQGDADTAALDYDLAARHVAVFATGPEADRVLRAIADRTAAGRLIIQAAPDTVWAWFSAPPDFGHIDEFPGLRLGVGQPMTGRGGFVAGHEQARAAHALGAVREDQICRFAEISLLWLTTRDAEAARRFVDDELGALLRASDAERMLETLESYFAAGHNGASAAARLGVSSRAVSYRLHAIEEVLGHAIVTRSAELQTALRLHRHLADS